MNLLESYKKRLQELSGIKEEPNNLNDNFWNWFSGSKVINSDGTPMIVHHGTGKKFSKFSLKNAPQPIIWFTSNKSSIEAGEAGAAGKGHVMNLYALIKNPAGWKEYEKYGLGQLKGLGYDGAILPDSDGSITGFVFEPNQLKSVKNKGEWNSGDKNIFNEVELSGNSGQLADDRKLGKKLSDQIGVKFINIYRAVKGGIDHFYDKDYVTPSKKFAIEHSESNHVYHEEPQQVIRALISTDNLYDAYNPGEYFYVGNPKKASVIYTSKGPDEYEGYEENS